MKESKKAAEHLRMVLPLMTKYDVPVDPENYAVWYAYVVGVDPNLNASINKTLESGQPFSLKTNKELFNHYIRDKDERFFREAQQGVHALVKDLERFVMQTSESTQHFGSVLSSTLNALATEPNQLKPLVKDLAAETQQMAKVNSQFGSNLQFTSERIISLRDEFSVAEKFSRKDLLTGLINQQGFLEVFDSEVKIAREEKTALCLMMVSIDNFTRFADSFGNILGDKLIRFVAGMLVNSIKRSDITARYDRSLFALVLPSTSLDGATRLGEIIRLKMEKQRLRLSESKQAIGSITGSVGVVQWNQNEGGLAVIDRCKLSLGLAESRGMNRVMTELDN